MPTGTIYSDPFMVVVDNGAWPSTAPWLRETTYLINSLGATTAMIAQTAPATYDITPVPWTAAGMEAGVGSETVLSSSASATRLVGATTANTASVNVVRGIIAIVCILALLTSAAAVWCIRRRRRANKWSKTKAASSESSKVLEIGPKAIVSDNSSEKSELGRIEILDIPESFKGSGLKSRTARMDATAHSSTLFEVSSIGSRMSERPPLLPAPYLKRAPPPAWAISKTPLVSILKRSKGEYPSTNTDSPGTGSLTLRDSAASPTKGLWSKPAGKEAASSSNEDGKGQSLDAPARSSVDPKKKKGVRFGGDLVREFGGTQYSKSDGSSELE